MHAWQKRIKRTERASRIGGCVRVRAPEAAKHRIRCWLLLLLRLSKCTSGGGGRLTEGWWCVEREMAKSATAPNMISVVGPLPPPDPNAFAG
jgi:hypothetical protein